MRLDFQVMHMSRADVVLGRECLHGLGPSLEHSYEHNTLAFEVNGTHVLLMGEQNVPPSPLFCSAELYILEKHNAIEEVYFCYVLPTSLSSNDVDVRNDDVVCDSPSSFQVHSSAMHKQVNGKDKSSLSTSSITITIVTT